MSKALKAILEKYGTEEVIARLMEQLRLLAEDSGIREEVAEVVRSYPSDTEYIYVLCEYTNLITYTTEEPKLNDGIWEDMGVKRELESQHSKRANVCSNVIPIPLDRDKS